MAHTRREEASLGRLRALASSQDGQFACGQALELGLTAAAVRWLRATGEVDALRRGVCRFRAASGEADPAVTAALACWPGAVISHGSAAAHHGLTRVSTPDTPAVTLPHGSTARRRAFMST